MFRLLIFTNEKLDLKTWQPSLESEFEITYISNEESFIPLVRSWRPHVVVYCDKKISEKLVNSILKESSMKPLGFIIVAPVYNLREEQLAFRLGADHFILSTTPIESIKARLFGLAKKIQNISIESKENVQPLLPQKLDILHYGELELLPDQNILRVRGQISRITPTQVRLLMAFLTHQNQLLTRDWIQKYIFHGSKISGRSIDAHISKLKRAIPILRPEIINVYGQGYILKSLPARVA